MQTFARIMLVDDEPHVLSALRRAITAHHRNKTQEWVIETFELPEQAIERAYEERFDLILSDYHMPKMNGVTLLTQIRELQPQSVRIILSGHADLGALIGAINEAQIARFISKPWFDSELYLVLQQALQYQALLMENQRLADTVRLERGKVFYQEAELRRLESESPGITRVKWGQDGEIIFDEFSEEELEHIEKVFQIRSS